LQPVDTALLPCRTGCVKTIVGIMASFTNIIINVLVIDLRRSPLKVIKQEDEQENKSRSKFVNIQIKNLCRELFNGPKPTFWPHSTNTYLQYILLVY
jgi:hypothetical protein